MSLTVFRFRLRDRHAKELARQARAVNLVWNYCNDVQKRSAQDRRRWPSRFDLQKLTAGASTELDIHAHTIQRVCHAYEQSRARAKRPWLRFRGVKSLGWVPFSQGHVSFDGASFRFRGVTYEPMHARALKSGVTIRAGSFSQDARGRWYINAPLDVDFPQAAEGTFVGVDLGLTDLAALSTGEKISAPQFYRKAEKAIASAQRARKRRLVRKISAAVANRRKDYLHKLSARLSLAHKSVFVGNVSSSKLALTKMAKSVNDAGWSTLRSQLSYKAIRHGGRMIEVDESYTSITCSSCGCVCEGRPKGIAGLSIRRWDCSRCGAVHDRDVNAAINIARIGLDTLAEGAREAGAATLTKNDGVAA